MFKSDIAVVAFYDQEWVSSNVGESITLRSWHGAVQQYRIWQVLDGEEGFYRVNMAYFKGSWQRVVF